MDWDWIAGNWKQLIAPMQKTWGKLSHNNLLDAAGERERLVELLLEHYGHSRTQAETELDEFARTQRSHTETQVHDCVPLLKP